MNPKAEVYARAIIASAVSLGELTPLRQRSRDITPNSYLPASVALALETRMHLSYVAGVLGVTADAVGVARRNSPAAFRAAQEAAREAIRYHLKGRAENAAPAAAPQRLAPAKPKPAKVVQLVSSPRPARRAVPAGARFENLGGGVSVIRLKPITESVVRHAVQQAAKGADIDDLADLFCVDADALRLRVEGAPA